MPILMVYLKANKENYLFYFVGVVLILKYHNLFWKVYIIFVFLYFHIKCSAFVFQSDLTNSCKCFSRWKGLILMWFCFRCGWDIGIAFRATATVTNVLTMTSFCDSVSFYVTIQPIFALHSVHGGYFGTGQPGTWMSLTSDLDLIFMVYWLC